jgi:hypothetical protein
MNMLLADIDFQDVVKFLIILLIFGVPVIGQLIAKFRQMPPPGQRPLPPRPALPDKLADQLEDFLHHRVAQKPQAKPARPAGLRSLSPQAPQPVHAEVVAEVPKPVGGQVAEHVQQYLDQQDFDHREHELGKKVAQVAQKTDQHLQQVFSHRVSTLEAMPAEASSSAYEPPNLMGLADDVPALFATGLLELLTTPESLRQAIVLNEVLHRPEERWG